MNKHGDQTRWRTQEGPGEAGARLKNKRKKKQDGGLENKGEIKDTQGLG